MSGRGGARRGSGRPKKRFSSRRGGDRAGSGRKIKDVVKGVGEAFGGNKRLPFQERLRAVMGSQSQSSQEVLVTAAKGRLFSKAMFKSWRNRRIVRAIWRGERIRDIAELFLLTPTAIRIILRNRIAKGTSVAVKPSGRPISAATKEARLKFLRKIKRNPLRIIRQMSQHCGVSENTGRRILKTLELKSRARPRRPKLTPENRARRIKGARRILSLIKSKPANAVIISSDESYLDCDPWKNSRTDRIIGPILHDLGVVIDEDNDDLAEDTNEESNSVSSNGEEDDGNDEPSSESSLTFADSYEVRFNNRRQRAPGLMVWGVCATNGASQIHVYPKGTKLDTLTYLKVSGS